jgi:hypothetical protein
VTCLVFYFYITRLISCISILTCITTLELPYGSAFMKINGALSQKKNGRKQVAIMPCEDKWKNA